jgi:uncharacterized glyoxalase superfamily protein PhnB
MAISNLLPLARNAERIKSAVAIINVKDVESTLLWYHNLLGLEIEFEEDNRIVHGLVRAGNTSFHFHQAEPTHPATACMMLYIDELDKFFSDIKEAGVEIVSEPAIMPWGMRGFYINDCNGFLVTLVDPSTGK